MTTIQSNSEVREIIGGTSRGGLVSEALSVKEALTGERLGRPAPLITLIQVKDALTGQSVGTFTISPFIMREALIGNSVGIDIKPQMASVVREVIGRDSSYQFETVTREVLAFSQNELVMIAYSAQNVSLEVTQKRIKRKPNIVWSDLRTFVFRELVAQRNRRVRPISVESVMTLRPLVVQRHPRRPPSGVLSDLRYFTARQLVVKSRKIAYVPVSGSFSYTEQQQVVQQRAATLAPALAFSPSAVAEVVQLTLQSKRAGYLLVAATVHELVLKQRPIPTFNQPTALAGDVQVVVQQRETQASQRSTTEAGGQVQQVAQQLETPGIVHSDTTVYQQAQIALQGRTAGATPRSDTTVFQQQALVVQHHDPIRYYSDVMVGEQRALVVQHFVPGPLPYTGLWFRTLFNLAVQHRVTVPPNMVGNWNTTTAVQVVAVHRTTPGIAHGPIMVRQQRVQYTLAAQYPLPVNVMGPEVGAQVRQQQQLAVQARVTESPDNVSVKSRFVRQVGEIMAVHAAYEDKGISHNDATVTGVMQQMAMGGEAWPSKDEARSEVMVDTVVGAIMVGGDVFPDPRIPLSDARLVTLHEDVMVGDNAFTDPRIPYSDAVVRGLAVTTALGDAQFTDPTLPVSDVSSLNVGALCAVRDPDLVGNFVMSEVSVPLVAEMLLLHDPTMVGITRRKGPRPVVTVSMS